MSDLYPVSIDNLQKWMEKVLGKFGLSEDHARAIADVLMDCELRGYEDHGVWFMAVVAMFYNDHGMNPNPKIKVLKDSASLTLFDGDQGCGVIACQEAMNACIEKAKKTGMAAAGIRNSGNFIAAAPFALQAVEAGMIGFATSNATPFMPPVGGIKRTFGTNPFAYAVPTGQQYPMLLDMSTTATAMAKVYVAAQKGDSLPPGLVEDAQGKPLTEPQLSDMASCLVLPLGGPKGYGLAMMVDILCGVLTGEVFAHDVKGSVPYGQFLWALDIEQFMPLDEFRERMSQQIQQIKSGKRKEGVDEILIPGERGLRRKNKILCEGTVELSALTWQAVEKVCSDCDVSLPDLVV